MKRFAVDELLLVDSRLSALDLRPGEIIRLPSRDVGICRISRGVAHTPCAYCGRSHDGTSRSCAGCGAPR